MLQYVTVGTNDLKRAGEYYDAILKQLGAKRYLDTPRVISWTNGGTGFGVITPYDGKAATVGNGCMVSFACNSPEQVDQLYQMALDLGGTDEGAPGFRGPGFYFAYFRDLDGNKMNFFHHAG